MTTENPSRITREDWIAALRSGKYEQARGELRIDDRFCCLGVACDIAGGSWDGDIYFGADNTLPDGLRIDLGITLTTQTRLTVLNDEYGLSFPDIADLLESGDDAIQDAVRSLANDRLQKEQGY